MTIKTTVVTACAVTVWCISASEAAAADGCGTTITRTNLVRCAVTASLTLQQQRLGIDALEGRTRAVSPWLPSNPEVGFAASQRKNGELYAGNWNATLSQELEIGGQRSARIGEASAAMHAQEQQAIATERDVATRAWQAYFEVLAARDAVQAIGRLEQALERGNATVRASAEQGLISGIDAEVAELTVVRLVQTRLEAQRREKLATAALYSLLGLNPVRADVRVEGELSPLAGVESVQPEQTDAALQERPEFVRAKELRRSRGYGLTSLERSRVPKIKLSIFAQRDGFGERVLGGGISLPIPLPHPVGRTLNGEIAESEALVRQADAELEQVVRELRLESIAAWRTFEAAQTKQALFTDERVAAAERGLVSIAEEISAGRLPISSAVVAQQTLLEFLQARIAAKLEVCLASVELARTSGIPLDGAAQ